jgi:hypothetical protein
MEKITDYCLAALTISVSIAVYVILMSQLFSAFPFK